MQPQKSLNLNLFHIFVLRQKIQILTNLRVASSLECVHVTVFHVRRKGDPPFVSPGFLEDDITLCCVLN